MKCRHRTMSTVVIELCLLSPKNEIGRGIEKRKMLLTKANKMGQ